MQNAEIDLDELVSAFEGTRIHMRVHGGNTGEAARRYNIDERKIVDFSSNANPLGPSSAAVRAARKGLAHIGRYTDPEMAALRKAIARFFGVKPAHVLCGSGSTGIIHLIPRALRPRKVLVLAPTFSEYASAVEDAGGEAVPFSLKERDGFRVDPLEMSFALKNVDMAFLCNPNNPTGQLVHKPEMLEIVRTALEHGVTLVVDESFMDFSEADSVVKEAVQTSHLICIRSFTKFFGMPGLRIGYAVSGEETIAGLREAQEPWIVTAPAEYAAIAALNDWGYIKKTRALIARERERVLSSLRVLPGLETFPSSANFILLKLTSLDGQVIIDRLGEQGLLVRNCSSFEGLDNRYIRIAVRTRWHNFRLVRALRKLLIPS